MAVTESMWLEARKRRRPVYRRKCTRSLTYYQAGVAVDATRPEAV
jgi:hypothetical protein